MGKRGPAPAPTALKLVRGVRKDRVNDAEPQPGGVPVRPRWLQGEARRVWERLAPDLVRKGVLTSWDVDSFAAFCAVVAENRGALVDLERNGNRITVVARELSDGTLIYDTVKNPAWQIAKESAALIVTLGGRFGLNPSDRQALKVGSDEPHAKGDLLSG